MLKLAQHVDTAAFNRVDRKTTQTEETQQVTLSLSMIIYTLKIYKYSQKKTLNLEVLLIQLFTVGFTNNILLFINSFRGCLFAGLMPLAYWYCTDINYIHKWSHWPIARFYFENQPSSLENLCENPMWLVRKMCVWWRWCRKCSASNELGMLLYDYYFHKSKRLHYSLLGKSNLITVTRYTQRWQQQTTCRESVCFGAGRWSNNAGSLCFLSNYKSSR